MASNAPRKLSHPTADAPPQVEEEQHTSETRSSSADWRSAACISCGATIQYITKGRRIGAPSRTTTGVVFLEDALLRPDPFSDARTGLPLQGLKTSSDRMYSRGGLLPRTNKSGAESSSAYGLRALLLLGCLALGSWIYLAATTTAGAAARLGATGAVAGWEVVPQEVVVPRESVSVGAAACGGAVGEGRAQLELDGAVVRAGWTAEGTGVTAGGPRECCEACLAARGCNVWVFCPVGALCGGQCWLKRQDDPRVPRERSTGPSVPWVSGALERAYWDPSRPLPSPLPSLTSVTLSSPAGDIRLRLRPGWSQSSVDYLRLLATMGADLCVDCKLYRAEPQFLLQGVLRAVIPANNVTTPGPKIMETGDVGWAGGGPGPDFFIYLADRPAVDWGTSHTVWAEVVDAESLATAKRIVELPSHTPDGPGTMRFLRDTLPLSVHPASTPEPDSHRAS